MNPGTSGEVSILSIAPKHRLQGAIAHHPIGSTRLLLHNFSVEQDWKTEIELPMLPRQLSPTGRGAMTRNFRDTTGSCNVVRFRSSRPELPWDWPSCVVPNLRIRTRSNRGSTTTLTMPRSHGFSLPRTRRRRNRNQIDTACLHSRTGCENFANRQESSGLLGCRRARWIETRSWSANSGRRPWASGKRTTNPVQAEGSTKLSERTGRSGAARISAIAQTAQTESLGRRTAARGTGRTVGFRRREFRPARGRRLRSLFQ
jgi:hypothetical protein